MSITDNATGGVNEPDVENSQSESQETSQNEQPQADVQSQDNGVTDARVSEQQADTGQGNAEPSEDTGAESEDSANESTQGFDTLGLPDEVIKAVEKVGFTTPSPIQQETIPLLMEGRDVVGLAQTGTGKTAAFALPVLSRIDAAARYPQALVLAPTRELALQVADSFQSFADHLGRIEVLPIYGGQAYGIQLSGLRRGAQIVVGTPGRVIDHLEKGSLDISQLKYLVLDEADEMLNMGFQEDVERILADTPDDKQVALFSATMPNGIRRISKQYLNDPAEVTVKSETRTNTNITQRFLLTPHRAKMDAFTRILEVIDYDGIIVFVRTKHETENVAEQLRAQGYSAAAINGDIAQNQRERTVDQLKDGRLDILVATDVAARGLDVERISHVVNFDIPNDTESYVHRIGRTGRAGRTGEAILFVTPRERRMLRNIERVTKARLEEMDLPSVDEVNTARKAKFTQKITEKLDDSQMEMFRGMLRKYSETNNVAMDDIAAALAVALQGDTEFLMKEQPKHKRDKFDRDKFDRDDRRGGRRDRDDRRGGRDRGPRRPDGDFESYRIAVGRRHNVRPGAIVGAIANEGGLSSGDFGRITITENRTIVELPKNLDPSVLSRLSDTRIQGQLINIEKDTGRPPRDRDDRGGRGFGGRGRGRDDRGGDRRDDRRGGRGGRGFGGGRDRDDRRGSWRD
ncbi:DEAD/DEAH box helicase [Corynebacterium incognita]|uniref:ATP-dependent RNA helicase DeaD n=1 Tax=Corynebacterium incognita TaxID=2754725 RepID=A0A7G7CP36_9CORY|nr:DEAD/DEAH box helicase [Corynebacterium incognita]QNE89352.1 DEAD/DEAH box helicase [Corynebacterium incognita]